MEVQDLLYMEGGGEKLHKYYIEWEKMWPKEQKNKKIKCPETTMGSDGLKRNS